MLYRSLVEAISTGQVNFGWGKAHLSGPISDAVIDAMVEHFSRVPSPFSALGFQQLGNAANRVRPDETAFSHRDALYDFLMLSGWEDPSQADVNVQWTRDLYEAVRPGWHAGIYVNGLSDDAAQQTVDAFRSATYERLLAWRGWRRTSRREAQVRANRHRP